jgi:hypothetical protein
MNRLRLLKPVVVKGKDIFGRNSWIKFSPTPHNQRGWYWKCRNEITIPINSDIARHRPRRITLEYKGNFLEMYEHIGVLRWTGLDGVVIESAKFPPYHGRTAELWDALKKSCKKTRGEVPWIRPAKSYRVIHKKDKRSISITPVDQGLIIIIILGAEVLGPKKTNYELPMPLDEVFKTYTLGWPFYLYYLSKLLGMLGWPHHKCLEWAQTNSREDLLTKISLHRLGDLLGGISLITHDHLISAKVISNRGRHKLDMDMIEKIVLKKE